MRQTLVLTTIGLLASLPALGLEAPSERERALDSAWTAWKEAAHRGDPLGLRNAEEEVLFAMRELDLAESEPLASAVVVEARRRLAASDPSAARMAEFAVRLAPSLPQAHWVLARARFATAPLSVGAWVGPAVDAITAHLRSDRHARPLLGNLALALAAGFLVAGLLAAAAATYRHVRCFAHDLHHRLPGRPHPALAAALVVGAATLLFAWLGGPIVWIGLLALLFSPYLGRQERWALAAFLGLAGLAQPYFAWVEKRSGWGDSTAALLDAVDARGDFSRVAELRERASAADAPPEVLFALARYEKRMGRIEEARALYDRILALRPSWPAAMVNRANLHFASGEFEKARSLYERATQIEPELAEAWFGLSRVHYRSVRIAEGQAARDRALELAPHLAERYNAGEEDAQRTHRYLVDVGLSSEDLVELAEGEASIAAAGAALLWGRVPASVVPVVGAAAGALVLLGGLFVPAGRRSRACPRCGSPICPRCERGLPPAETCSPCTSVFSRQRGLDPAIRNRKEVQVARYQRRRHLAIRIGAPVGAGPLLSGRTAVGIVLVTLIVAAILGGIGGPHPPIFGAWPPSLRAAFSIPLVIAVVASYVSSAREEG